jgi:hypothetical protein
VEAIEKRLKDLLQPFKVDFEKPLCALTATRILTLYSPKLSEILYSTCYFAQKVCQIEAGENDVKQFAHICRKIAQYDKNTIAPLLLKLLPEQIQNLKAAKSSLFVHLSLWKESETQYTPVTHFDARIAYLQFSLVLALSEPKSRNLAALRANVSSLQEDIKQMETYCSYFPSLVILSSPSIGGDDWSLPLTLLCPSPLHQKEQGEGFREAQFQGDKFRRFRGTSLTNGTIECKELGGIPITPYHPRQYKAEKQVGFTVEIRKRKERSQSPEKTVSIQSLFVARAVVVTVLKQD